MLLVFRSLTLLLLLPLVAGAATETPDFDTDGTEDYAVFRQSFGDWYIEKSSDSSIVTAQWGIVGDYPVHGKYTGTTGPDLVVYRPSTGYWYLKHWNAALTFTDTSSYQWGGFAGDIPYPCDFTGDGKNEIAIFRPSDGNWYARDSANYATFTVRAWGSSTSVPIAKDYDGDGTCDYTVYDDGVWSVLLSSTSNTKSGTIHWGQSGDIPVPGHYDSDSIVDFAVYREVDDGNSLWLIRKSVLGGLTSETYLWGEEGDFPVARDVDGDGKTDIVVWRPDDGNWYALLSSGSYGTVMIKQFGLDGDIPIGERRGSNAY